VSETREEAQIALYLRVIQRDSLVIRPIFIIGPQYRQSSAAQNQLAESVTDGSYSILHLGFKACSFSADIGMVVC